MERYDLSKYENVDYRAPNVGELYVYTGNVVEAAHTTLSSSRSWVLLRFSYRPRSLLLVGAPPQRTNASTDLAKDGVCRYFA